MQPLTALLTPAVMSLARKGLLAGSAVLTAYGVPGLDDGTVSNLASVAAGAVGILASVGWSFANEYMLRAKVK